MDVEGAHGRIDRGELAEPSRELTDERAECRQRLVHHGEPDARHPDDPPDWADSDDADGEQEPS